MIDLKATQGRLVVKLLPKENEVSGIYLATEINNEVNKGVIESIGPAKKDEVFEGKVGDTVIFGNYQGLSYTYENEEYRIINQSDIVAIKVVEE